MVEIRRRRRLDVLLEGLREFWSAFRRSRKGMLGVAIIIFFTVIAILAPLLTPYDPLTSEHLAGTRAKPAWLRNFPGYEWLSCNMEPIRDWTFSTPDSVNEWELITYSSPSRIKMEYHGNLGSIYGSGAGCILISYQRSRSEDPPGNVVASIRKVFHYPYSGPAARFACSGKIGEKITRVAVLVEREGDINYQISLYISDPEGNKYELWTLRNEESSIYEEEITVLPIVNITTITWEEIGKEGEWVYPNRDIDSLSPYLRWKMFGVIMRNPAIEIFNSEGDYVFGLEVRILDSSEEGASLKVYVDDLYLKLYGTCFGLLGTDWFGRDIFTQLVYGARMSLIVGLLTALFSVVVGLVVGLLSGYLGGWVDEVLMRFTDMLLVLPYLPFVLVVIAVIGPSIWNLILIMAILGWMGFGRVIRAQVLSLKERPFVEAARAVGAGTWHIILRHILPNVMSFVYVALALSVPSAIVTEAALSWLGLGDPFIMTWGRMLHDVQYYAAYEDWWWVIPPGLCIALLALAFVLIGYSIDEILNPRLRRRR